MLESKLAAFAGALILAGSVFAQPQMICPDINEIKAEGISMAEQIAPSIYLAYNISTFNTPDLYGFVMAPFQGDSEEEVIEAADEALSTMSAPGVPEEFNGSFVCTYETGRHDLFAVAIKGDAQITPMQLKQYFLKNH